MTDGEKGEGHQNILTVKQNYSIWKYVIILLAIYLF